MGARLRHMLWLEVRAVGGPSGSRSTSLVLGHPAPSWPGRIFRERPSIGLFGSLVSACGWLPGMGREPGLGEPPKHKSARGGPEVSEPATESSGLLAHICRLCGSHHHSFPLTASQTIKEPPSPSSCFLGRSSCLVMILEGKVFCFVSLPSQLGLTQGTQN